MCKVLDMVFLWSYVIIWMSMWFCLACAESVWVEWYFTNGTLDLSLFEAWLRDLSCQVIGKGWYKCHEPTRKKQQFAIWFCSVSVPFYTWNIWVSKDGKIPTRPCNCMELRGEEVDVSLPMAEVLVSETQKAQGQKPAPSTMGKISFSPVFVLCERVDSFVHLSSAVV